MSNFLMPLTVSAMVHVVPVAYWAMTTSSHDRSITVFPTYEMVFQEAQEAVVEPSVVPQISEEKPAPVVVKTMGLKKIAPKAFAPPEEVKAVPMTSNPSPDYPIEAREDGIEGTICLKLVVNGEGKVIEVSCPTFSPRLAGLKEAAIRAAKKWRFEVTGLKNRTQTVTIDVPFEFSLRA